MMLALGSVLHKGPGSTKVHVSIILSLIAIRLVILPAAGA